MKKMTMEDYWEDSTAILEDGINFPSYDITVNLEFTHRVYSQVETEELHFVVSQFKKAVEETFYNDETNASMKVSSKVK